MKIIVTGGCGFIGHHFVEHVLKNTIWEVCVVDKLGYSSYGYERLRDIDVFDDKRVHIVNHDFTNPCPPGVLSELSGSSCFIHMAAETHVDNSIIDPVPFIVSNVLGTHNALMAAREVGVDLFVNFSTDEVFGPASECHFFGEWDAFAPSNPYAASKAGAVHLGESYMNTYGIPVITTFTMNVFGERQHPEKFIPLVIRKVLAGDEVTIHADSTGSISGSRMYIHARSVADAVLYIMDFPTPGDRINIVGEQEVSNLDMAQKIADIIGMPLYYKMVDFHSSRPGHDLRYALDGTHLRQLGFKYKKSFDESLEKTVRWTLDNKRWLTE